MIVLEWSVYQFRDRTLLTSREVVSVDVLSCNTFLTSAINESGTDVCAHLKIICNFEIFLDAVRMEIYAKWLGKLFSPRSQKLLACRWNFTLTFGRCPVKISECLHDIKNYSGTHYLFFVNVTNRKMEAAVDAIKEVGLEVTHRNLSICSCLLTRLQDSHNIKESNKSFESLAALKYLVITVKIFHPRRN
jgi:hypothetical protein